MHCANFGKTHTHKRTRACAIGILAKRTRACDVRAAENRVCECACVGGKKSSQLTFVFIAPKDEMNYTHTHTHT